MIRQQTAEASKDPIKFAEFMARFQQSQQPSAAAQMQAQKANQVNAVWMTVYLERCKAIAADKEAANNPALICEMVEEAGKLAAEVVKVAKDHGRL